MRHLRNHNLSGGAGTLGVWWELRVESTKMGRGKSGQGRISGATRRALGFIPQTT